jgi:hypothetical protein
MAYYTFEAPVTVLVTWSWSNLDLTGGWSVSELGSGEPVDVASLAFSGSTFATVGGVLDDGVGFGDL